MFLMANLSFPALSTEWIMHCKELFAINSRSFLKWVRSEFDAPPCVTSTTWAILRSIKWSVPVEQMRFSLYSISFIFAFIADKTCSSVYVLLCISLCASGEQSRSCEFRLLARSMLALRSATEMFIACPAIDCSVW